jgi:hypothetical protein
VHLALRDDLGAFAARQCRGGTGHQQHLADVPSAPAEVGRDRSGVGPQQGRRLVRPARVAADLGGGRLDAVGVHRVGEEQPVVVPGGGDVRVEDRDAARHVAHADGPSQPQ